MLGPEVIRTDLVEFIRSVCYYPGSPYRLVIKSTFCRHCGASIPHRDGEGRCPKCIQHLPQC